MLLTASFPLPLVLVCHAAPLVRVCFSLPSRASLSPPALPPLCCCHPLLRRAARSCCLCCLTAVLCCCRTVPPCPPVASVSPVHPWSSRSVRPYCASPCLPSSCSSLRSTLTRVLCVALCCTAAAHCCCCSCFFPARSLPFCRSYCAPLHCAILLQLSLLSFLYSRCPALHSTCVLTPVLTLPSHFLRHSPHSTAYHPSWWRAGVRFCLAIGTTHPAHRTWCCRRVVRRGLADALRRHNCLFITPSPTSLPLV